MVASHHHPQGRAVRVPSVAVALGSLWLALPPPRGVRRLRPGRGKGWRAVQIDRGEVCRRLAAPEARERASLPPAPRLGAGK